MSCFLCFICHNTVHSDTNAETREKYRELIGMKLCPDSHICHICCHLLRKLWLFKSICLRRSMEYPVLFSDRGTVNLHNSQIETVVLCPNTEECEQLANTTYHFSETENIDNQYVSLEDRIDANIETAEKEEEIDDNIDNVSDNDDNDVFDEYDDLKNNEIDETKAEDATDTAIADEGKEEFNENNDFYKIVLSVEEQKAELEQKRREDKYLEAEFKCYNCAMAFLFKDTYQAHMMRHEESNGEHLCPICLLRFASGRVLRAHTQAHRERHACARCGRHVRPRRRRAHRARCADTTQAICHLCSKSFSDGSGLQQHIKRFHLSKTSNKTYSCHVCGKTYNNQAAVRTHMMVPKKTLKRKGASQHPKRGENSGWLPHSDEELEERHASKSQKKPKKATKKPGSRASEVENEEEHSSKSKHINKKFPCPQCPSRFSSPYSLAAHARRHARPCRLVRSARASAQKHQGRLLECHLCSKTCTTQRSLDSHIQTVHSTDKPFCCGLCGARYTSKKSLGAHLRGHRGVEPKQCVCHICGTTFKGNSKLNRHLRSVCEKNKLEEELSAFYNQE